MISFHSASDSLLWPFLGVTSVAFTTANAQSSTPGYQNFGSGSHARVFFKATLVLPVPPRLSFSGRKQAVCPSKCTSWVWLSGCVGAQIGGWGVEGSADWGQRGSVEGLWAFAGSCVHDPHKGLMEVNHLGPLFPSSIFIQVKPA